MRKYIYILLMCIVSLAASAQDRTVQNRPYTDLRPFHFGVVVGMHVQDMEVLMAGPQTITTEDGTEETLVTADQSRWDPGINVGVLGELRLSTHFQLRVSPMMYFGTRHIVFHDLKKLSESGQPDEDGVHRCGWRPYILGAPIQQPPPVPHGWCVADDKPYGQEH